MVEQLLLVNQVDLEGKVVEVQDQQVLQVVVILLQLLQHKDLMAELLQATNTVLVVAVPLL